MAEIELVLRQGLRSVVVWTIEFLALLISVIFNPWMAAALVVYTVLRVLYYLIRKHNLELIIPLLAIVSRQDETMFAIFYEEGREEPSYGYYLPIIGGSGFNIARDTIDEFPDIEDTIMRVAIFCGPQVIKAYDGEEAKTYIIAVIHYGVSPV